MIRVAHLLNGLAIGGKERAALRLARRGRHEGQHHEMVLFDHPFRGPALDFDPGEVPTYHLPRGGGVDLRFAVRLARHLRRQQINVVHAHNDTALFYAAMARLVGRNALRVVATFHTWPTHASRGARWLSRAASLAATTVAVSPELAGRLLGTGWLGRCRTIANGVDGREFFPLPVRDGWRRDLGLCDDAILVGHVARFDPIKRHADLLDAAAILARDVPQVMFLLVGQGPLAPDIEARAAELPNIRILPQVTAMAPLLRSLDILTLCSAHEAAPLALLEAMACAVPIVATAVGGMPDMVGRGPDAGGLLVPPLNPEALAGAIGKLATDAEARACLGAAALRRAEASSFDAEWAAYAALYAPPPSSVA